MYDPTNVPSSSARYPASSYPPTAPYPPTQPGGYPPSPFMAPVPVALPPVTTRRNPLGAILASISVLVLVAAFGALLFLHAQASTASTTDQSAQAQAILNRAAQVKLRDTQLNVSLTEVASSQGSAQHQTFTVTATGKMAITSRPYRLHLTLTETIPGSPYGGAPVTIEEIVTSDAIYLKTPSLPGAPRPTKPWIKANISAAGSGSTLASNGFLDFTHFTHPTLIGEETINGRKTWHLRVNLANVLSSNPSEAATATAIANQGTIKNLAYVEDLWIIEANAFPAQIKMHESVDGAISTVNGSATTSTNTPVAFGLTIDMTYVFTSWNTGLTIALPPPNQVTTPSYGAAQAYAAHAMLLPTWLPLDVWSRRLAG